MASSSWTNPLQALAFITDNPAREFHDLSEALSALGLEPARQRAEQLIEEYQPIFAGDDTAAVLQIFLDKLPKEGQAALIRDIIISETAEKLRLLRNHLVDAILKPMKLAGGKQPPPAAIGEPFGPTLDELEPFEQDQIRLKEDCLKRDGFRCIVTGDFDRNSCDEGKVVPTTNGGFCYSQCAHILPFALSSFDEHVATETRNKAIIWFALHRYFPELRGKIDASKVNNYENLMTLDESVHTHFGHFVIGFWPTESDNIYRIRSFDRWGPPRVLANQEFVQFISHDPRIPLPDKDLLMTHCRIAEILQVSGIGRRIEDALDNALDDPVNMRSDGSTDLYSILKRKILFNV